MWFFRRNKSRREPQHSSPPCSYCGSTNTELRAYHGTDQPDYVRVWRGQRSFTYRCFDCGREFYGEEPPGGVTDELLAGHHIIDDEEELSAAEDEIRREIDEDGDRRC